VKILIDLDNTIIDSATMVMSLYNKLYSDKIKFDKKLKALRWDFSPYVTVSQLPNLLALFEHEDFYSDVKVIGNALNVINSISKTNDVTICSKHTEGRKVYTEEWVNRYLPNVKLNFVSEFEDKAKINSNVQMVIDDRIDCLNTFPKEVYKICFGFYDWNKDFVSDKKLIQTDNWDFIHKIIQGYDKYYEWRNKYVQCS